MVSTSPISRSWRAARSMSSLSMPLTSRRRSTARPATARPSASSGRPALVVSVITKPRPSLRSVSTACCMRCAAAGSSQAPKASTRSGTEPDTTMAGIAEDFRLVAARRPGHQHLRLRQQQRLEPVDFGAQRHGFVVRRAFDRVAAALRVRNSTMVASTAKQSSPSVSVRVAICWRPTAAPARIMSSTRLKAAPASARAGVLSALQSVAKTKAARNPPRLGRERSLSFAVRIVSGIQTCPRNASGVRRAVRESQDFTPEGNSCRKSPDRERSRKWPCNRVLFAHDCTETGPRFALFQRCGPLRHVLDTDAAERRRKCVLGFDQRRLHHVIDQRRVGQRRIGGVLGGCWRRAGCLRR